ncbi:MAG: LysE family translocator [Rhizobiaceae bacterium]|jgi:threonine/homoserine/homoserine lactone efflux protein|nr:LysE family translocator [Rhizobiaceae bacterium]
MTPDTLIALIIFAFVTSVTPGPNNMMLLASGVNFGLRATWPHIFGIAFGVSTLLLSTALGLGALFTLYPPLNTALKIIGAGYMLWLAWKIATSGGASTSGGRARPMRFFEALAFQWINPKAWMMALGAVAGYLNPAKPVASGAVLIGAFWITGIISIIPWAAFGQVMRRFLDDATRLKWFNITMGVALAASIWPMLR